MALPGHSPPPAYNGPGAPIRSINSLIDTHPSTNMFGPHPRPMLPPSPQHFHRYSQSALPAPLPTPSIVKDVRIPPQQPFQRPGSSMSISSMLGAEPERISDTYSSHLSRNQTRTSSISGPSMSLGAVMSPPQYPTKPNSNEYQYRPRSETPDRVGGFSLGPRQHRSSSGTMTQRPGPFYPQHAAPPSGSLLHYSDHPIPQSYAEPPAPRSEADERVRRTSLSGILQRPDSQPQLSSYQVAPAPPMPFHTLPESTAPSHIPILDQLPAMERHIPEPPQVNGQSTTYDLRPPGFASTTRPLTNPPPLPNPPPPERRSSLSKSPETRRQQMNGVEVRGISDLIHPPEVLSASHAMARQDSMQSQSDRSGFGERSDRHRFRPFSPFAPSVVSQNHSLTSVPTEEMVRKGSDELSQHRAILGLAADSKRGRYSPLPQAVQGAQAQTPVPDAGIKTEHGRVFSGIGAGLGTSSASHTPAPTGLPASPFKRDDGPARLSEENLMKMSRSASGMNKRPRKVHLAERADSEDPEMKRNGVGKGNKRSKYQHSYKADLEEDALLSQRRAAASLALNGVRNGNMSSNPLSSSAQPQYHHPLQKSSTAADRHKSKQTFKFASALANANRMPRRHLGTFSYQPQVSSADVTQGNPHKFNISIQPNHFPSFTDAECVNCTYTVCVPRMWLQERERGLICAERYLWGTGVYTDDTDPLAAAIHSGFLTSVFPEGIDSTLLKRVTTEQNPKIQGVKVPDKPIDPEAGKDVHITLVVLPQLAKYQESVRYGLKSRSWPELGSRAAHDGVSFAVLKVEFVDFGTEIRKVGRTGKDRRDQLKRELQERMRGLELQKAKLDAARKRLRDRTKGNLPKINGHNPISKRIGQSGLRATTGASLLEQPPIQQAAGDWIGQLAVAAA